MSWLSALHTDSLQCQMNKNYPAITNFFAVNHIIRYNGVFALTNNFFGTVALPYSGVPLYTGYGYCLHIRKVI